MMEKDVRGWCLGKDSSGTPTLSECVLARGVGERFFTTMTDRDGNPITIRSFQLGESFFENKQAALREMLKELSRQYVRYAGMVDRLDRQIREVVDELDEMQEAGDARR